MTFLHSLFDMSPLRLQFPELLLLAIPLWFAFQRWGRAKGVTGGLRLALVLALLFVFAGPEMRRGGRGIDVIVVADLSRSMPTDAEGRIKELTVNLQKGRGPGDRVGLVTFGSKPEIEEILSRESILGEFKKEVLPDGSDLNAALHTALNLVQTSRPARILLFSDGEANGASPLSAARRAREMHVPIDYRAFERLRTGDAAIDSILLPETVAPREPFQFSVWIESDRETEGRVSVYREGEQIASSVRQLHAGSNQLLFRDLLESPGLTRYEVKLEVEGDPLKENNIGRGVVRVEGGPELLVLNADGKEDNLVRALRAGRVTTSVAAAAQHPLTQESLVRYRAVILENVPASDVGRLKMERLVQFVEDLGGGLMLTGGERSFGTGGYFKSPLDDVLPVSMEMREEHRKTRVAIAIALDRSGSMAISVKGGKTKMDLANLGTAECIKLLSPGDSVAVIAVDSSPHVVQPLTPVDDPARILPKVLKIESMGGGIFVYEALVAAGDQLMRAEQSTRHIILFSDAADSEEPGNYKSLLAKYEAVGITTSVIGLGSKTDVDAKLLEDVAALGKGNIMFTADPEELPRLFTQDTMSIARNSFIKKEGDEQATGIPAKMLADIRLMGEFSAGAFPRADGYNLSYLKPDATLGVVSQDEYTAPWSAFWYRGLGRVAALTIEVDGQYTGQFGRWDEYADFLVTQARWLLGGDAPDAAYLTVSREGQDAVVTLELDPERGGAQQVQAPSLVVARASEEPDVSDEIPFEWQGANVLQTRFKLDQTGTYLPVVKLGGRKLLRGPAITLPYSPEYAPRSGLPTGADTLKALAELTGGKPRVNPREVLADPPRSNSWRSLAPLLLVLAVALLLLEIAGRRLSLWEKLTDAIVPAVPPTRPASRARRQPVPAAASARTGKPRPVAAEAPSSPKTEAPAAPAAPAAPTAADVFEQAKRRARKRL